MSGIPKCKDGQARLPITIQPNTPGPGSYTVHFGGEGGGFNASHIIDLPLQPIHMYNLAMDNGFFGICQEEGNLYVESTLARDAAADLSPSSHVINLSKMFKDIETGTNEVELTSIVETSSVVPGELEAEGMDLHKKGLFKEAQQAFDEARLNHELHTAAGMYYAGLNALELPGYDLIDMGEHELSPSAPIDPTTFRRILMLWGAATAFSQSEKQAVGLDDPFIHLARKEKAAALASLERLGQLGDPQLTKLKTFADLRLKTETTGSLPRHPEQVRRGVADLERRLKKEPNNRVYLRQLALAYSDGGKIDEAIKLALRAGALSTDDPHGSYGALAEVYRKGGDKYRREHIRALERLVASGPESQIHTEWRELAELYMLENNFEKAVDAAKNAVSRAQQKVEASKKRVKDSSTEQRKFATNYYTKAKAELADALNFLASIYMVLHEKNTPQEKEARDNLHKAVEAYHGALEVELNNFDSMLGLARAWAGLNNYKEALWAIAEAVRLKGDDPKVVALVYEITFSQKVFQQADEGVKEGFRKLSAQLFIESGQNKLRGDGHKDKPRHPLLGPEQLFRYAAELKPENIKAWQGLGLTLYHTSAQHRDKPKHSEGGLESLARALDLLAKNPDPKLKGLGLLSKNGHVELLVALVTLASEVDQWQTVRRYLMQDKTTYAIAQATKRRIHMSTVDKNRKKYKRELAALDKLLALGIADPRLERLVSALKMALLSGLEGEADINGPKVPGGDGSQTLSGPSSTPEPANGSPNTSGPSEQSAAPELNTTVTLGSFYTEPDEQSQTTSSTSSTAAAIRRRRNRARAKGQDAGNVMYGSGVSTFGARPAGQTNSTAVQIPVWLFRPVGR